MTEPSVQPIEGTNLVLFTKFEPKFSVGDIVVLKTGGPRMTVVDCDADGVEVTWFAKQQLNATRWPLNAVRLTPRKKNGSSV